VSFCINIVIFHIQAIEIAFHTFGYCCTETIIMTIVNHELGKISSLAVAINPICLCSLRLMVYDAFLHIVTTSRRRCEQIKILICSM
jgi:hypothetical protein